MLETKPIQSSTAKFSTNITYLELFLIVYNIKKIASKEQVNKYGTEAKIIVYKKFRHPNRFSSKKGDLTFLKLFINNYTNFFLFKLLG
jgi:hypothetical protein